MLNSVQFKRVEAPKARNVTAWAIGPGRDRSESGEALKARNDNQEICYVAPSALDPSIDSQGPGALPQAVTFRALRR